METITIDLKKSGLTHAKGRSDACGGEHVLNIDLDEQGFHPDGDCLTETALAGLQKLIETALAGLQKLHEAAHPQGSVSVLYCREQACADIMDELASEAE